MTKDFNDDYINGKMMRMIFNMYGGKSHCDNITYRALNTRLGFSERNKICFEQYKISSDNKLLMEIASNTN